MKKIESEISKLEESLKTTLPAGFKTFLKALETDYLKYIKNLTADNIDMQKDIYLHKVKPHPYNTVFTKDNFGSIRISGLFTLLDNTQNSIKNVFCSLFKKICKTDDWLPFADDGGGGYICIGIQQNNYGKVAYLNYDIDEIADSFDSFLNTCKKIK
jgi:cell wall assembly regulator SMI1